MDDNFVNAVDLGIDERDFNAWLIQLANENKEDYRFGKELQYYTAAIEAEDAEGTPISLIWVGPLVPHSEELKAIDPQVRTYADPTSQAAYPHGYAPAGQTDRWMNNLKEIENVQVRSVILAADGREVKSELSLVRSVVLLVDGHSIKTNRWHSS